MKYTCALVSFGAPVKIILILSAPPIGALSLAIGSFNYSLPKKDIYVYYALKMDISVYCAAEGSTLLVARD